MNLSSLQLSAFAQVARAQSFSLAARRLHITQSALSQRILKLESELGTTLILRESTGLRLTAAGEDLLRFCQMTEGLEAEVVRRIAAGKTELSGSLRIAGFSSVVRSIICPSLTQLLLDNPGVTLELMSRELRDLPKMLGSGESDFIVTTILPAKDDIESIFLGYEENVMMVGQDSDKDLQVFLDHDAEDQTTIEFLKLNHLETKGIRRHYFDEIYGIIDGVRAGIGKAVLPKHLISADAGLKVIKGLKPLKVPVYLQHFRMDYYTLLHRTVLQQIQTSVSKRLS